MRYDSKVSNEVILVGGQRWEVRLLLPHSIHLLPLDLILDIGATEHPSTQTPQHWINICLIIQSNDSTMMALFTIYSSLMKLRE